MTEKLFEEALREAARDYNPPPPTPREEIWAGIQRARAADELRMRRIHRFQKRIWWGVGIAAALLLGIGIGRFLPRPGGEQPVAARTEAAPSPATTYQVAATQHLSRAEVLLTAVKSEAAAGALDRQTVAWARDLLSTTRLLLDSRATADPELRVLLQDLELVLAQIVQVPAGTAAEPAVEGELDLVKDAIEGGDVMPRLRSAIPAGPPTSTL